MVLGIDSDDCLVFRKVMVVVGSEDGVDTSEGIGVVSDDIPVTDVADVSFGPKVIVDVKFGV